MRRMLRATAIAKAVLISVASCGAAEAWSASSDARFKVTVQVSPPAGAASIGAPPRNAAAGAAATGGDSVLMPDAMEIQTSGAVPSRIRFEIIDPGVSSVDVLGFPRSIHVTTAPTDVVVPMHGDGDALSLSFLVRYRDGTRAHGGRAPLRATFLP